MATNGFSLSLASSEEDLQAAQRLRYDVFVRELGAKATDQDHAAGLERDPFDDFADHLLLRRAESQDVVGVYRLMRPEQAKAAGGFYTESEFDLSGLLATGRPLLELGRSCLHADVRGKGAMYVMWAGLAKYVQQHRCELLFGVASLKGTDLARNADVLALLHQEFLAPEEIRPHARSTAPFHIPAHEKPNRKAAMLAMPQLLKGYLRIGGRIGQGVFVDHAFNCTDVCMVMDTQALNEWQSRFYRSEAVE